MECYLWFKILGGILNSFQFKSIFLLNSLLQCVVRVHIFRLYCMVGCSRTYIYFSIFQFEKIMKFSYLLIVNTDFTFLKYLQPLKQSQHYTCLLVVCCLIAYIEYPNGSYLIANLTSNKNEIFHVLAQRALKPVQSMTYQHCCNQNRSANENKCSYHRWK